MPVGSLDEADETAAAHREGDADGRHKGDVDHREGDAEHRDAVVTFSVLTEGGGRIEFSWTLGEQPKLAAALEKGMAEYEQAEPIVAAMSARDRARAEKMTPRAILAIQARKSAGVPVQQPVASARRAAPRRRRTTTTARARAPARPAADPDLDVAIVGAPSARSDDEIGRWFVHWLEQRQPGTGWHVRGPA